MTPVSVIEGEAVVGPNRGRNASPQGRFKLGYSKAALCSLDEEIAEISASVQSTGARGRRTVNVLPSPTRLDAPTLPRSAWARCLTIDSPNPVPPTSRERALSTR